MSVSPDDSVFSKPPLSSEVAAVLKALDDHLGAHEDHPWYKVGRCVYCGPCGVRLYQGTVPKDHPVWVPPRRPSRADEMRKQWDKDK